MATKVTTKLKTTPTPVAPHDLVKKALNLPSVIVGVGLSLKTKARRHS